ncbi:MAG: phosphate ABC transporter, permease protein PstA [Nocardioidaceae bacterium]
MALAIAALVTLLVVTFLDGYPRLDGPLFTAYSSEVLPESGGARAAILGSLLVIIVTAGMAIPLGVAAAIYLEEFADDRRWYNRLIEVNLQNLAAVPAIVYGMLTAGFALAIGLERRVVLSAAIALALLILPVIIITTREALRAVPGEIRQGVAGARGYSAADRVEADPAVRASGVATGTILALSRALGEAAPLLLLGGAGDRDVRPERPVLRLHHTADSDLQLVGQSAEPHSDELASAAIIVLLALLLLMNALAIVIRNRYQRSW